MNDWQHLIETALATLPWPLFATFVAISFRKQFRELIPRLRRGKFLGTEWELDEPLKKFKADVDALAAAPVAEPTLSQPPDTAEVAEGAGVSDDSGVDEQVAHILDLAAISPSAALMQLSAFVERVARQFLAVTGHGTRHASLGMMAGELENATGRPPGYFDALREFSKIRNAIVHGARPVADEDVMKAIDSGIVLLRALASLPYERHTVHDPGVLIFSRPDLTDPLPGLGLIILSESPGGESRLQIYPTKRADYVKGMEVTWEWDRSFTWPEAWYRSPDTGEVLYAWTASQGFVGRDVRDI